MIITKATLKHLDDLIPLFNGYRVFYKQVSNLEATKKFLTERLKNRDSVIYIMYYDSSRVRAALSQFIEFWCEIFERKSHKPTIHFLCHFYPSFFFQCT